MGLAANCRAWAARLKRDALTLWFAARHPRTPWYAKALAAFVVAYALSPIDLIPDFIPVLGLVDDALLLPALIWLAVRLTPADVLAACRAEAAQWLASSRQRPKSRAGAVVIVALWLAAGLAVLYGVAAWRGWIAE
ncbi:YkvA family protein [Bordetella petrii]|uniref:YkvA family protein n=1 Tax=Bordetella petrii TaxID=94624 RepID=A0ABT7W2A5_9BORD|nr:YkvA family protein [Bordetella petrii]MDM9559282.1 YkvA family protein [Bordetella petrii]